MARLAFIIASGVVFCFLSGCATLGPEFTDEEMGYAICPPANWVQGAPNKEYPNIRVLVSSHIRGEHFRPTLNIVVEETELSVEEYVDKQKSEVLPELKGFELISEEPVEIGKHWRLVYKLTEAGSGEKTVRCWDCFIQDDKLYGLTFVASESQWERMKETFFLSVETFKIRQKKDELPPAAPLSPPGY